ncbi:retinol dehydrogenase 12 [Ustulina deusta]|nr:retinol dehydrogenase 12 [Ustulina deusta]
MSSQLGSEASFEAGLLGFLYRQWMLHRKPVPAGTDLSSQVAIITGSNSGLGLEAGRQLLQLGLSHLILAVRSQSRGEKAADGLRQEYPGANVSVWLLDMSSYDSIAAFVEKCKSLSKINIVILNAGLRGGTVFKTAESTGHEYSFQVNYISTALLAILLLPILKSKRVAGSKQPVLSIVTSDSAYWTSIETQGPILTQLDNAENYSAMPWYQKSKLLQYFFVSKLAEEIDSADVIVNLANPGLCNGTAFEDRDDLPPIMLLLMSMWMLQWSEARKAMGAMSVIGQFSRTYTPSTEIGAQLRERLWEETMEELNFAGASDIIQRLKKK